MIRQPVLCLACGVSVASAQQLSWSQFVSDTNSPQAFLSFGQAHLSSRKDSLCALAESAFVRAARLDRGDTVNAVREVSIAFDVAPSEPLILAHYGAVLVRVGRPDDALKPLQSVVRTDPADATPYLVLGMAYTDLHRDPEALHAFEMFLDHAAKNDERRAWATYRVRELRASVPKLLLT